MALQNLIGRAIISDFPAKGILAFGVLLLDATAEKAAIIFRAPKVGTLDKFEFSLGTVTFNAASVLRVSFQDVDTTTGFPDGTQDEFRDITTLSANAWNVPGLITSDGTDGGVKRVISLDGNGDLPWLACVIEYQTFTAADAVNVRCIDQDVPKNQFCFSALNTGTWAGQAGRGPAMALKYNDGTYAFISGNWPASAITAVTYNSGSTPDERGMIFRLPFPCKLYGCVFQVDMDGDCDVVLYDSDGATVLKAVALDANIRVATSAQPGQVQFPTPISLLANTSYRLTLRPSSVTSVILYEFDVNAAAIMDSIDGGQTWHHTSRANAGAWTEVTTKRPFMGLLVGAADDGASLPAGYTVPTEAQVEDGVLYGAGGTEFEGTLAAGGGTNVRANIFP